MTPNMEDVREAVARALWNGWPEGTYENSAGKMVPAWSAWLEPADRVVSALAAVGLAVVPVEPTEAMAKAGGHANSEWLNDNAPIGEARYREPARAAYRAMLAASPLAASPDQAAPPSPLPPSEVGT